MPAESRRMRFEAWARLWFCLASAVIAATIGDIVLESASTSGLFGAGNFTDGSLVDIVPALAIGVCAALAYAVVAVKRVLAQNCWGSALTRWSAATDAGRHRLFPFVLVLQFAALFSMESIEEVVVRGHLLGPTIWLGAPAPIAILTHALLGATVLFVLRALLSALVRTAVSTIVTLLAVLRRAFPDPIRVVRPSVRIAATGLAYCGARAGRAPPARH